MFQKHATTGVASANAEATNSERLSATPRGVVMWGCYDDSVCHEDNDTREKVLLFSGALPGYTSCG